MEMIKHEAKHGRTGLYQNWNPAIFQKCLSEIIKKKEDTFGKHVRSKTVVGPIMLVLGTDGVATHEGLVEGSSAKSDVFSYMLVHMGYVPTGDSETTGGHLILDLKDRR